MTPICPGFEFLPRNPAVIKDSLVTRAPGIIPNILGDLFPLIPSYTSLIVDPDATTPRKNIIENSEFLIDVGEDLMSAK